MVAAGKWAGWLWPQRLGKGGLGSAPVGPGRLGFAVLAGAGTEARWLWCGEEDGGLISVWGEDALRLGEVGGEAMGRRGAVRLLEGWSGCHQHAAD